MGMDMPPKINEGKKDFEKIKNDFSVWVDNYLKNFYEKDKDKILYSFRDPVREQIDKLVGDEDLITLEMKDLTVIFCEKLIKFCNNLIFTNEYNYEDSQKFYKKLYETFFNVSPNIFENLNIDFTKKILISSRLNETYQLRNIAHISGEIAYDLSFNGASIISELIEDIKKLNDSEKISVVKQLSTSAMTAYANGNWAYPAFIGIIDLIKEIKNSSNSPIISFVLDYELEKIKNYSSDIDEFEDSDIWEDFEPKNKYENLDILRGNLEKESFDFFKNNKIIPELNDVLYSNVSKDYGTIMNYDNFSPFGLIKKNSSEEEISQKENISSVEDSHNKYLKIKDYEGFTKEREFNPLGTDDFSHLIKIFHSPEIRSYLNNRLNIKIEDLFLKEQIYFLKFLSNSDESKFNTLEKILKDKTVEQNKNFLRSFISMSGDESMGANILALGEKLPEDVAKKVFIKYGEIIDNVNKITEFARNNFTKEIETNPELIEKIEKTLYIKGKQLLSQVYNDINNKKEINYENISKQLDRINADTITTFAIFKQAIKNGEKLPIESIEGSVFSKKEATDISDIKQNEMLELYELNWKNHSDRNFVESLKTYFKTAFFPDENKQKNYFYTFEKDNNIRAFVRFEKQKDQSFYASALNVDEASKNFGLGEAMMDEALIKEAEKHILHASCRKDNPSNMRYFEKGFISKGFKKTNETEEFDLVWDNNKNKDIKAKQKSQEELISMYKNINTDGIEIRRSKDLETLHNDIPNGKSLVRCFINNGEWYSVYETIKENYGINL